MLEGCTHEYNAFSEGYTLDGDNNTRFPLTVKLDIDNVAAVWAEALSSVPAYGAVYGCRYAGCTPLQTATLIQDQGALPPVYNWPYTLHQNIDYIFDEDKIVYVNELPNGGGNGVHFVLMDSTGMNKISGPTLVTSTQVEPVVHAYSNGFTIFMRDENWIPPDVGIWKTNYDHFGNVTGSITKIKGGDNIPRNMYFSTSAKLKEDTSKYILLTYYMDYGSTDPNLSRVEGIVTTELGTVINSEVIISRTRGNYVDTPCTVVPVYREGEWVFMVFWWEGVADSLSVRLFSRAGTPITAPNVPTGGVIELFTTSSYAFRNFGRAVLRQDGNILLILSNSSPNYLYYMIISPDLDVITPLTSTFSWGFADNVGFIELINNGTPDRSYYVHTKYGSGTPDKNQIIEFRSSSSSSSSVSSSSTSSSSESSSSSSTSETPGFLTLKDQIYDGIDDYIGVWGDGNFVYAVCGNGGIRSYSVDGSGNFTSIDHDDQGGSYYHVWGDGNYLYVSCYGDGIRVYSVDGSGFLTHLNSYDNGGLYYKSWGDGTYLYCAAGSSGLRKYTIGAGTLTYIGATDNGGDYRGVWGDENFLYAARYSSGIISYEYAGGGGLTFKNSQDHGGNYLDIWGDGDYIYAAADGGGIKIYSTDGAGIMTYEGIGYDGGNTKSVYGVPCANLIFTATASNGLKSWLSDGIGGLSVLNTNNPGGYHWHVWTGAGLTQDFVYVAADTLGLLSFEVGGMSCSSSSTSISSSSSSSSLSSSSSVSVSSSSLSTSSSSESQAPWTAHFDNTNWTGGTDAWFFAIPSPPTTWTGAVWTAGIESGFIYHGYLNTTGIWALGYRPNFVRIFHTAGANINFLVYLQDTSATNSGNGIIAGVGYPLPYLSGAPIPITFVGNDIWKLRLATNAGPFNITNIEFQ